MKLLPRLLYLLNRLRYRLTRPVTVGVRLHLFPDAAITQVRAEYIAHDLPKLPAELGRLAALLPLQRGNGAVPGQ